MKPKDPKVIKKKEGDDTVDYAIPPPSPQIEEMMVETTENSEITEAEEEEYRTPRRKTRKTRRKGVSPARSSRSRRTARQTVKNEDPDWEA